MVCEHVDGQQAAKDKVHTTLVSQKGLTDRKGVKDKKGVTDGVHITTCMVVQPSVVPAMLS